MRRVASAVRPTRPHLKHEKRLRSAGVIRLVAGVDEVGRGPLAGPVVAAAVILPENFRHRYLNDSKKLSPDRRDGIYEELTTAQNVVWAFASLDAAEVDRLNILRAAHEAMRCAVLSLSSRPCHVLIDGRPVQPFPIAHTALVGGDGISLSIAAASVIAKVTRDRMMVAFDAQFPAYGFSRHKGYSTSEHLAILARDGPCPIHRRSFRPVAPPLVVCRADGPAASAGVDRREGGGELFAAFGVSDSLPPVSSEESQRGG